MGIKKQLGLVHIFCIASGAMISSGIFVLPGLAHAKAGPAVVLSYLLAGLLAMFGLMSIAELTTAMPKAGGDYFYVSRGAGPAVGTIAGLLSWFSLSLKSAFAIIGIAVLLAPLMPISWHIIAVIGCVIFVCINLLGTREAANFQVALVIALLLLMVVFIVRGFSQINPEYLKPFTPYGIKSVFATTGFVFVSYGGLIQVASMAGEIKNPGRTIPLAMIMSLVSIVILYVLMVFVTSGVLGSEQLDNSLTPIADAAEVFAGRTGYVVVGFAAALAFITTANAGIMTASRYLLALSRDGLLPAGLSKVSKNQVPYSAVLVTGIVIAIVVFVKLDVLVEAASTVFILSYILAGVSVILLRESRLGNYRPSFRAPFYPWTQIVTIIVFSFILLEMGEEGFAVTVILILAGAGFYWYYGRASEQKESALLHLIERIAAKELVTGTLENELKQIVRHRDEIVADRFDRIIEGCLVLDIEQSIPAEEFFRLAAERLSQRLGVEQEVLFDLLAARERQSGTVMMPDLAVPHIVIEGEGIFDVLVGRCRSGIRFSEKYPRVKKVFVLAGTKDERNFHLQAISAIAQVVQNPEFDEQFTSAKDEQALRDVILLAERNRSKF
ncbi:MAG: amino acid permease [Phycisphaerae bacterium]|jgi:amino acid transporter